MISIRIKKDSGMTYQHALRVKKFHDESNNPANVYNPSNLYGGEEDEDVGMGMLPYYVKREISRAHVLRAI